jgi:hypothetical protein
MSRKPLLDLQHPWFIPLWRRVAVTAVCAFWTVMEVFVGGPFWLILFGALTAYCGYSFFVAFNPRPIDTPPPEDPKP